MDLSIALILGQDGIVNGAIYGLMALALVLVFSVTRVIFIPQGEFVAFSALSVVALPLAACALVLVLRPESLATQTLAALAVIVPLGPLLYRLAYRPLADATV